METLPLTSPLRRLYPDDIYPNGDYFPSPFGRVRYWIIGPSGGKKLVLIHGISVPSIAFQDLAPVLVASGFQVLLYDTCGRGYSEAPHLPHDPNLYIIQLALLMQYVGWAEVDVVVGFSMGGAIAAAFAASFPHLVKDGVAFLASAGLVDLPKNEAGEFTTRTVSLAPQEGQGDIGTQFRRLQVEFLPGFSTVLSSSVKNGVLASLHWAFETLGKSPKRFLVIHGSSDPIVPYGEALKIKALISQAELVTIEGAGHYLVKEEGAWQVIAKSIITFFAPA